MSTIDTISSGDDGSSPATRYRRGNCGGAFESATRSGGASCPGRPNIEAEPVGGE